MPRRSVAAALRDSARAGAPALVFLAGPNGGGKSTFFRTALRSTGIHFVNGDVIASELRSIGAGGGGAAIDRLAFETTRARREELLAARVSFCTESVFSDPVGDKLDFLDRARSAGFAVILVFIGLESAELSIARVVQRVAAGGHDVPDVKLVARYPRTLANLRRAIPIASEAFLFDNSSDTEPFRPVAVFDRGRLVRRFDPAPRWARGLPGLGPR